MQKNLFALAILLVTLTYANSSYPTFAKCNQSTISQIQSYWLETGKPTTLLRVSGQKRSVNLSTSKFTETAEKIGRFAFLSTSYDHNNLQNKCLYANFHNGSVTVTMTRKNGGKPYQIMYSVKEGSDGVLTGSRVDYDAPEFRWNWYTIYSADGILICYVCSDIEGSSEKPLATILVSKNSYEKSSVKKHQSLLKKWGFNLNHNYGVECVQQ